MAQIKSVMFIDCNDMDNFINNELLKYYGVTNLITFKSTTDALSYLEKTTFSYQFILVDIYMPVMDGFTFIDKFYELGLHKKQGKIGVLSASLNPFHKEQSIEKNVGFIEKPLTMEKLLAVFQEV